MLAVGLIFGFAYAQADVITATLEHTAGTRWSSAVGTNTVDSEKEYYNNDASTGWAGAAYAEFSFSIPEGATISKATLTYSVNQARTSSRDDRIYYMNPGFTLDYDAITAANDQDLRYADNRTVAVEKAPTGGGGDRIGLVQDVTDAVKAIYAANQNYVIFQWTNNAASAELYGKASANAPTLVIETVGADQMTKYTIKYTDGTGAEIRDAKVYDILKGESATASEEDMASFFNADNTKKYIYESGNTTLDPVNDDAAQNVITLVFREAATYNYTINASVADKTYEISKTSYFEGEKIAYNYPRYYNVDGALYEIEANGSEGYYKSSFVLDQDNKVVTVSGYSAVDGMTGIVFLKEAEDIETLTEANEPNAHIRMSMGKIARNAGAEPAVVATLPAGKYKLLTTVWGGAGTDFVFRANGEIVQSLTTTGSSTDTKPEECEEFTLNAETDITLDPTESGTRGIDYVLIQKTGDVEIVESEYAVGKMVFADLEGVVAGSIENGTTWDGGDFTITLDNSKDAKFREWNEKMYLEFTNATLTVKAVEGKKLNRIVLTGSKGITSVNVGELSGSTWTGDAESVTFTFSTLSSSFTAITVGDYKEPAKDAENIAAVKALGNNAEVKLALNGAKVTIVHDGYAYIEDETGGLRVENGTLNLTAGTALTGYIMGTYSTTGPSPTLLSSPNTGESKFESAETVIIPTLANVAGLNANKYINQVVKLVGDISIQDLGGGYTVLVYGGGMFDYTDNLGVIPADYVYPEKIGSMVVLCGGDYAVWPVSPDSIVDAANVKPIAVSNIAALKDMPTGIDVELNLNGAVVTVDEIEATTGDGGDGGVSPLAEGTTRTIILEDKTAAVQVNSAIAEALPEVFTGDSIALTGSLVAKLNNDYGAITLLGSENTANSEITSAKADVTPTVMTILDSKVKENSLMLVQYAEATVTYDEASGKYNVAQGENTVQLVDKFKKMEYAADGETEKMVLPEEPVNINGIIYYGIYTDEYEFWPLSYSVPTKEPVYKEIAKTEVFLPTVENVAAAVEEGWAVGGEARVDNKKGNIDPATGETLESATTFPGVGLKKDNESKTFVTYVTGVNEVVGYGVTTSSSETRSLVITATPADGGEAVVAQAESAPNTTAVVTLALDATKKYMIEYTGVNADNAGGDIALHGIKFAVATPEPQEYRKWDFTAWSEETKNNIEADASKYTEAPAPAGTETGWRRYEKDGVEWTETDGLKDPYTIYWYGSLISEPTELKANGEVIAETKGLLFNGVSKLNNTVAFAMDYPSALSDYDGGSYLWLNGGGLQFTIPAVMPGQKVLMEVESHKDGNARGVSLSVNGTKIGEDATPTEGKVSYEWTIPTELGTDLVDVLVTSTSGCHIYLIEAGDADKISTGINEVNAEVKVENQNVYTINGVMVRKAGESLDGLAKGLYIVGGKKVVIK